MCESLLGFISAPVVRAAEKEIFLYTVGSVQGKHTISLFSVSLAKNRGSY
jgi:hypothetical protein